MPIKSNTIIIEYYIQNGMCSTYVHRSTYVAAEFTRRLFFPFFFFQEWKNTGM